MRQSACPSTKVNATLPDFLPFRGLRYAGVTDATAVAAPPYDVIDDDEREVLERADPHNAVRLILPRDDADASGGLDRYGRGGSNARDLAARWGARRRRHAPCSRRIR